MIVLDTHAWVWWTGRLPGLSRAAKAAIESAPWIGISAMSCWELAMLVQRRKIELDRGLDLWVAQALAHERVEIVPVDLVSKVAIASPIR